MQRSYVSYIIGAIGLVLLLLWLFAVSDDIPETPEGVEAEAAATE